jgi:kinesin family member 11
MFVCAALVDDSDHGTVCQGLTEVEITNLPDIMKLLSESEARCRYSETKMNKMSNRAHRIFTILVSFRRSEVDVNTSFTLVDLAGSEDISRSGAKGLTARETSHINKSLLTLGRVINSLALNEKHIPYRDSKLTRLLSEALGGVCKTSFIACVSPSDSSRVETASTLRYAQRAMEALNIDQLPRWKQVGNLFFLRSCDTYWTQM